MSEAPTESGARAERASKERASWAVLVLLVGLLLSAAGVVDGVVLSLKRQPGGCSLLDDGQTRCLTANAHAQAGLGIAVVIVSLTLAALMVLAFVLVNNVLHELRADHRHTLQP